VAKKISGGLQQLHSVNMTDLTLTLRGVTVKHTDFITTIHTMQDGVGNWVRFGQILM